MSASLLLDRAVKYVRSQFDKQALRQVELYGGQFNADEIDFKAYACPAVFLAVRGWQPMPNNKHLAGQHVLAVELSAFVITKHANRTQRMLGAMLLAEQLALVLQRWQPDDDDNTICDIAPLEDDATCENLYNRKVDKQGQALWVVHWQQCIQVRSQGKLWDWLSVQVDTLARTTEPDNQPTNNTPIQANSSVNFAKNP